MKKKNNQSEKNSDMRRPNIPPEKFLPAEELEPAAYEPAAYEPAEEYLPENTFDPADELELKETVEPADESEPAEQSSMAKGFAPEDFESDDFESEDYVAAPIILSESVSAESAPEPVEFAPAEPVSEEFVPAEFVPAEYLSEDFSAEEFEPEADAPLEIELGSHGVRRATDENVSDDPSEDNYPVPSYADIKVRKSRSDTLYEPRQKKKHWFKPIHFVLTVVAVAVVVLGLSLFYSGNIKERFTSPMTLKDTSISNAEFSFMYHYVLIENGINVLDKNTDEVLSSQGENGFATYRDYFLDMAAREIQITRLLSDDAASKGYQVSESNKERAEAYINWLTGKAAAIGVDLDTYITGYFGTYVTADLIREVLTNRYFTEDYANGAKLDELKATQSQAEDAYAESPNMYDQVSYRVLRIVFEQMDDSFKATAHLRAQEIIDGIGHDQTKFESVAASFFSGDAKEKILQPDSTLIANVRYPNVDDAEWRAWLFDTARKPGDCTIFDDSNGFPILVCFAERTRQLEPLRDIRLLYINRENTDAGKAGIPAGEILPLAQTIFDSVTNESTMQTLETTYSDEIAADKMKASHNAGTYKGVLPGDLDEWIFDPARVPGEKTIIETDTQVIIAFYVGSSQNPEWFDRVNSFIRMNNYQAFLLETATEYPYELNADGLQYIKD